MIIKKTDKFTRRLTESFEMIYPSLEEIELTKTISDDIISLNDVEDDYTHIVEIENLLLGAIRLRYENCRLPFITNLNIYCVLDTNFEDDTFILYNNAMYEYDLDKDVFTKKVNEVKIKERYTNIPEIPIIMEKNRFKEASIMFIFKNRCVYNKKLLIFILRHEFVHLKDSLERQQHLDVINSDTLLTYAAAPLALNMKATINSKRIYLFIKEYSTYLNISELNAYVTIAMEEISDVKAEELKELLSKTDSIIKKFLDKNSKQFAFYNDVKVNLSSMKSISKSDKENFADVFIKKVFGRKTPDGFYPYGSDFKDNGEYTAKSFDMFIDELIKRIEENFENNCVRYFRQCQAIIEYHNTMYSGISVQRTKPLFECTISEHRKMENR